MIKNLLFLITITLLACGERKSEKSNIQLVNADSIQNPGSENSSDSQIFEEIGFNLMTKESVGKLKLGLGLNDLITIFGEPVEKSKDELWEADGEYHQTYMYPNLGIQLDMIGESEADKVVNMITITGPCDYKTNKGISIGSRYDEVKAAYKDYLNPYFSNRESIVAGSIYGGVVFGIEKDRVKSIFIGASAE